MSTVSTRLLLAAWVVVLVAGCGGKSSEDLLASAKARAAQRDHAGAVLDLKSVLQLTPDSGEARYLLGVALLEQGDAASALVELRKAEDLKLADDQLLPKLARALLSAGKAKEVIGRFAGIKLGVPVAQAELHTALANAYASTNQIQEAEVALSAALKASPGLPWAQLTSARLLTTQGKFDEALAALDLAMVPAAPNGEPHLLRGMIELWGRKDLSASVKSWELAAADPATTLQARSLLIQTFLSQGADKLSSAKGQLAVLVKAYPRHPQALYMDAVVSFAAKDFARTEALTEALIRLTPNNHRLLVLAGAANLQLGHLIAAETKLGRVVQTVERATVARKLLAETYLRMGQPEKSISVVRPLLEQAALDPEALALAGQAHLLAGNPKEAEAAFSQAVKLNPGNTQVRTALALTDLVKGNAEAAFDALQSIAANDPGQTADLALISAHLRRREYDSALTAISLLEKKRPGEPTVAHLRGVALRGKGDRTGARVAFEAALKAQPGLFSAVSALASMDVQDGKLDVAAQRFRDLIQLQPAQTEARMALVSVMARQGATSERLLAEIDAAVRAAPTDAAPRIAKIARLSQQNEVKGAVAAALDAMAALPDNAAVLDAAGQALANGGDDQQAISAFNKLAAILPKSPMPLLRLADIYRKRGNTTAAAASLSRAFEVAPESADVQRRLLAHATGTKDFKAVLAAAKDLQKRLPRSAMGYLLEGDAHSVRKSWSAAIAAYRSALPARDPVGRPQKALHGALLRSGDRQGARRFADDWLKSEPKDASFREYLGSEALLRSDYVTAKRYFEEVVSLQPRNSAAFNNLAWLMAERGEAGAVAMAERALALTPEAAPLLDTYARALSGEGHLERAIGAQRRALVAAPDRPQYRLSLARLLIAAGKKAEARAELLELSKLRLGVTLAAEVAKVRDSLEN